MLDRAYAAPFAQTSGGQTWTNAATVVPNDNTPLPNAAAALFVTATGNIVFETLGGQTVTLTAVPVFTTIPITATLVKATGTTATVLALW